jgi:hypothetical protein
MPTSKNKAGIISKSAESVLHDAFVWARQSRHKIVTVEGMLLALLDSTEAKPFWLQNGAEIGVFKASLILWLENNIEKSDAPDPDTQPTLSFQRVVQRAIMREQSLGQPVSSLSLLSAIFSEKESFATTLLTDHKITKYSLASFIAQDRPSTPPSKAKQPTHSAEHAVPQPTTSRISQEPASPTLFISYSHADDDCLNRLLVHLKPLHRSKAIACWSDKSIRAGDKWRQEIRKNLSGAKIAVLLISADFLASDFIVEDELPPLLVQAESKGTLILPVILKPCGFSRDPVLSSFQAVNDPALPLLGLSHIDQEAVYNRIADHVTQELSMSRK